MPVDEAARLRALDTGASLVVQAPAGSGKTELLTQRFLKLLAQVDQPEEILAITFTRAATAEMRARVLKALHAANSTPAASAEGRDIQLARAALANDARQRWQLLEQPQRLNIQTIDSMCLAIAHQAPLLAKLGGGLTPTENAQPLYALAARRTLARLGGDKQDLSDALSALLQLRSTSLWDCQQLLAGMLSHRNQWGPVLALAQGEDWLRLRGELEATLLREHHRVLGRAQQRFAGRPEAARELMELIGHACGNLALTGSDAALLQLRNFTQLEHLLEHAHWNCVCDFLLVKEEQWRKQAPPDSGFLNGKEGAAAKQRYKNFVTLLAPETELLEILCEVRNLPPAQYSEEEWQSLQHMLVILRHAAAELRIIFAAQQVVDFPELLIAARQVLQQDEAAAQVAGQWRHILVDEFQDTSRGQYELLTMLAEGWESGDRGTFFLVGDPMQSIYMFRQAEVELFEQTRLHGLGEGSAAVALQPVQLQTNFRSHAGLVDRLNEIFTTIFAAGNRRDGYQVAFAHSSASEAAPRGKRSLHIYPAFIEAKASEEERARAWEAEAQQVVEVIQKHGLPLQTAKLTGGQYRVAVLVRAKRHLRIIAQKLHQAQIPFRAVEIEELSQRQEVMDLTALVRALSHPMDRIAWLTVLRAPWCGLSLADLYTLCGQDDRSYAKRPALELLRHRVALLSDDGQRRAARVLAVLEDAVAGRHREVSLASWVERVWRTLGGRHCVDPAGYENVRAFFAMLQDLGPELEQMQERIDRLCAQPDPDVTERCGVQLMTIHKAKGLGFDVVIVPGLQRVPMTGRNPLLRWLERTQLDGDHEQREFLLAPIGAKGKQGGIYEWIGKQKLARELDETTRLLYVACTRAQRELHLLATATVKTSGELSQGDRKSLLAIAWSAIGNEFQQAFDAQQQAPLPAQPQMPLRFGSSSLRRLPAEWAPPVASVAIDAVPTSEVFARSSGSLAARAFGVVVHALLEDLAQLVPFDPDAIPREVEQWRPRALALLRHAGLPRNQAEPQSAEVVRALLAVLRDPNGRWILGARAAAQTEASWSTWEAAEGSGEVIRTLRGDRIFRAGATPGSSGRNAPLDRGLQNGTPRRVGPGRISRPGKSKIRRPAGGLRGRHAQGTRSKYAAASGALLPAANQAGPVKCALCVAISPEGTTENSPGRESWVQPRSSISPVGTTENSPGRESWVKPQSSISPAGTTENSPGRESWVQPQSSISPVGTTENYQDVSPGWPRLSNLRRLRRAQDSILGHFLSSLRDWSVGLADPGLTSWAIFCRPSGTELTTQN